MNEQGLSLFDELGDEDDDDEDEDAELRQEHAELTQPDQQSHIVVRTTDKDTLEREPVILDDTPLARYMQVRIAPEQRRVHNTHSAHITAQHTSHHITSHSTAQHMQQMRHTHSTCSTSHTGSWQISQEESTEHPAEPVGEPPITIARDAFPCLRTPGGHALAAERAQLAAAVPVLAPLCPANVLF